MKYTKHLTVREWKRFDKYVDQENGDGITAQEILLRNYKIILTDHQTRGEKLKVMYNKLKKLDLDKTLTKVTKGIDDFSKMTDSLHGIGGKEKDLSELFPAKKTKKTKGKRKSKKEEPDKFWGNKESSLNVNSGKIKLFNKGLKLR